ncbi:MAG: hypothetical protein MK317_12335, partial [Pseudomonadales bacterium]|nr:hypothetical protein [Pseudomonadales bacterium]
MSHPIIRFLDRAKETTSTTGTGTITLGGAVAGFVAIGGIGDGNSTYYTITEGNEFEVGIGTYTSSGNTLSRDQVFASSNAGNKITLAGSATVFITYPADKTVAKTSGNYVGIGIDPEYQLQVSGTGSFNTVRWADGTTQITSATGDISTVSGLTVTNASNISTNTTNIAATGATNAAAIATNTTNIATNATDIATNTTNIAATGATNAAAIATNVTNIATNATNISTNPTNIAATRPTNAAAITVNTTDINTVSGLLGPSGNNTEVQFNDNGEFGSDSDFTWNKASNTLTIAGYALPNADAGISGYVLTSNADGTTQWAEASGGGGGGGAPTDADYITLSTNAGLSDERVLSVGTGLQLTDGGAGSNVTVDASGATT